VQFRYPQPDCFVVLVDQNGRKRTAGSIVINSDAAVFRGSVFKRSAFSQDNNDTGIV
jgi:hypothetical protein